MFGVVTSAYQVEGAWNEDGKGETIWDHVVHHDDSYENITGDVACDSYHKFADDIALAADLGVKHFKFSISWSRILPDGISSGVNLKGISYYQNLIEQLQQRNIEPIATLYHWDLPQHLQDIGGWTNPAIIKYFVKYARTAFQYFDTVKYWVTFEEPKQICLEGYGSGTLAPEISVDGIADYLCSYVVLKAHAAVYSLYHEEFPALAGKVGIVLDVPWSEPSDSNNTKDIDAAERRNQFLIGLYANPIFNGNWPDIVIKRVQERSTKENFTRSRLPQFTEDEIESIKGSLDYLGFNFHDTRYVVDADEVDYGDPKFEYDMRITTNTDNTWLTGANEENVVPWGIRKALNWIKSTYNDPTILITENSVADDGTFYDIVRIQAMADYLDNILDAIYEDEVTVIGYTLALLDDFQWNRGYSAHHGLYSVDFQDVNRSRTAKISADYYRQIATDLVIPTVITSTTNEDDTTLYSSSTTTEEPTETTTDSTTNEPGSSYTIQSYSLLVLLAINLCINKYL